MRRLLPLLLAAGPLLARAQTPTAQGSVAFAPDSTVNRAECSTSSATMNLEWWVKPDATFTTGGVFRVYAASADFGTASPYCYTSTTSSVTVKQLVASDISASAQLMTTPVSVSTADLASVTAQVGCASGSYTVYVCVQWLDSTSTVKGYAKGTVTLTLDGPDKPSVTDVQAGDQALHVTLAAASTGIAVAEYRAKAVSTVDGSVHFSSWGASNAVRVDGLVNGTPYVVTGFTRSAIQNESPESDAFPTNVAPRHVQDAFEHYRAEGGRDSGGCDTGGAGLLALLGAASLLTLRRRA